MQLFHVFDFLPTARVTYAPPSFNLGWSFFSVFQLFPFKCFRRISLISKGAGFVSETPRMVEVGYDKQSWWDLQRWPGLQKQAQTQQWGACCWRERESGDTDVEGCRRATQTHHYTVSMEHQEKKLRCREHTLPDMLSHTQSHDIALSHNLNWIPRAYRVPCSPKALCMFSECLAYAAVTWAFLRSPSFSLSRSQTQMYTCTWTPEKFFPFPINIFPIRLKFKLVHIYLLIHVSQTAYQTSLKKDTNEGRQGDWVGWSRKMKMKTRSLW